MKKKFLILMLIVIGLILHNIDTTNNQNTVKNESIELDKNEIYQSSESEKNNLYSTAKEKILQKSKEFFDSIFSYTTKEEKPQKSEEIFDSILSKDAEKFKSSLKPSIQNKDNIDIEIEEMLKFIDGNIISFSNIKNNGYSKSKEYFTTVFLTNNFRIDNIKTDTGRTYTITYSIAEIDKDNSKNLGMESFGIYDNDLYDSNNGYPYSGKYIISEEEVDIVETATSKHIPRNFF